MGHEGIVSPFSQTNQLLFLPRDVTLSAPDRQKGSFQLSAV
jgi:hypothetical protein